MYVKSQATKSITIDSAYSYSISTIKGNFTAKCKVQQMSRDVDVLNHDPGNG